MGGFLRASWHPRWHKISLLHTKLLVELPHFVAKMIYSPNKKTSCHRKKLPFTVRTILSHEESSCHRNKLTGKNLLSQEDIFCDRKQVPVTGNKFLWQEKTSLHTNKILILEIIDGWLFKNKFNKNCWNTYKLHYFIRKCLGCEHRCFGQNLFAKTRMTQNEIYYPTLLGVVGWAVNP
jgi:hypothetical protein